MGLHGTVVFSEGAGEGGRGSWDASYARLPYHRLGSSCCIRWQLVGLMLPLPIEDVADHASCRKVSRHGDFACGAFLNNHTSPVDPWTIYHRRMAAATNL